MIRKSTPNDREQIVDLIGEFFDECINDIGFEFNREKVAKDFDLLINNPIVLSLSLLDGDKIEGFIAAVICERPFFTGIDAQELVWYVRKNKRREGMRLLKEFENECSKAGCKNIIMIGLDGSKIEPLYLKFGYKKMESNYTKKVGG